MPRLKILYIEHGLHQKQASTCLQDAAALCGYNCSFTVVSDAVQGLECVSFTCYSLIVVDQDLQSFTAADFALVLRKTGIRSPLVLLESRTGATGIPAPTVPLLVQTPLFAEVLRRPFSPAMLCQIFDRVLFRSSRHFDPPPLAPSISAHPSKRPRYEAPCSIAPPFAPHTAPFSTYSPSAHFHPLHSLPPPPHAPPIHTGAFYGPAITNDLRQLLSCMQGMTEPFPPPGDFAAHQFVPGEVAGLQPPLDLLCADHLEYSSALGSISEGDEGSYSLPSSSQSEELNPLSSVSSDSLSEDLWENCDDLVAREAFGILFGVEST